MGYTVVQIMQDLNSTTHYYSESQQEHMLIAEMPVPHAKNAYEKMLKTHGNKFIKTPLAGALAAHVLGAEVEGETEVKIKIARKQTEKKNTFKGSVR